VLAYHDYKSLPVVKCTSIGVQGGNLVAIAQFVEADLSASAQQIYQMLAQGFLKDCSAGFIPIDPPKRGNDGVLIYGACELLEFSIPPIPSNPDALRRTTGAKRLELSREVPDEVPALIARCLDEAVLSKHANRDLTDADTAALVVRLVFGSGSLLP
jgi:hypothetical protein